MRTNKKMGLLGLDFHLPGGHMSEDTRELVRAITEASEARRETLVHNFIESRWQLFKNIAHHHCRNYGVPPSTHHEDFTQMVAEEAYKFLMVTIEDPEQLDEIQNWEGMLKVRSRNPVKAWMDKYGGVASGMSTVTRRIRTLNAVRDEMTRDGAEVSKQEIVNEHNRRMYERRANPENERVIATVDDLSVSRYALDVDDYDREAQTDDDFVLHPTESARFVRLVVDRTTEANPKLGECARLWLQGFYRQSGQQATVLEIAEAMGISPSTVRKYKRQVKDMAREILREELGITEADVA